MLMFFEPLEVYLFDSLEFHPDLRRVDQVSDIAFLVVGLIARARTGLACLFLNAWLDETGDYDGLAVLRFYMVCRSIEFMLDFLI
jgi:aminoglycoside phosphotransferase family enzyme